MQNSSWRRAAIAAAIALVPSFAMADDWVATKLRGRVLQLVDNQWQPLGRGDMVSDDRVIRTVKNAKVTFQRGNEIIDLGGDTQIQIHDRSGKQFTTVQQYFGTVAIKADVRQVQHFAVTTPHLAAVVKGTRFTVVSGNTGAKVSVQRGHVEVEDSDTHQSTMLAVGQSAQTSDGTPLAVAGKGELPTVYAANGKPVSEVRPSKSDGQAVSPKAAAAAARDAALAAGATRTEADRAAKAAEKEAKEAAKAAEKDAAAAAYVAAVASGASGKETEKAAKEAAKDAKDEAKAAEKEAKAEEKAAEKEAKSESKGSDNSGSGGSSGNSGTDSSGSSGSSGNSGSDSGGGGTSGNGGSSGDGGGDSGGGKGKKDKD
jgi:uncharacterized membrane protein YgcG